MPPDPFDDYVRRAEAVPPCTAQEESALWEAIKRGDDADAAKKRLLEAKLHMVIPIARQYERPGLRLVDLVQEGNLGLVRAVELFDPSEGRDFSPFASRRIEDAIASAID
jgi:DNA-directed RNA polymerase sigma subunit (sigma70/sigma32)